MLYIRNATFLLVSLMRLSRASAFVKSPIQQLLHVRSLHGSVLAAKPKRGGIVDSYQTVSVNCAKCSFRLFRYKKKNGTKSNLIKCYVERIVEDCGNLLPQDASILDQNAAVYYACPSCQTQFARPTMIRGMPALKLVGGKTRMTKK